jgi:hypothetical protein
VAFEPPQTVANSAVPGSVADARASRQSEPTISGVIVVPLDPAALPEPPTVDGVFAPQALLALAAAGSWPLA